MSEISRVPEEVILDMATTPTPEEPSIAPIIDRIKSDLNGRRQVYETFAKRGDFGVKFGDSTAYDHTSGEVIVGVEQLYKLGMTKQIEYDFAVCHELGHMKELYDDPEGYAQVIKKGTREDNFGKLYFRLYNCLMDLYVNKNNANVFSAFAAQGKPEFTFSEDVEKCYREKLFRERDWTEQPFCLQYSDYLLQLGMGTADDIQLSPEVAAVIEEGIIDLGKQYTYKKFIRQFLWPKLDKGSAYQATVGQRKSKIERCIEPIFERLLKQDIEKNKDLTAPNHGQNLPDIGNLDDALSDARAKKAEREMSPEDRAKREAKRQAEKMAEKSGLNPEEAKKFLEFYEEMQPTIKDLCDLWRRLRTEVKEWVRYRDGFYKTGANLSVPEYIRRYATISQKPDQVPIMERDIYEQESEYRPRTFRLTLMPDLSGSMSGDIEKVQKLAIALAASLSTMNSEAHMNDDPDAISCGLDVIGYSDNAVPILEGKKEVSLADIMKTFGSIKVISGTSSDTALKRISENITPDSVAAMAMGDEINILIELTDGDTNNPAESIRLLDQIEKAGYHTGAIKFGYGVRSLDRASDKPEEDLRKAEEASIRDTFGQMWNRNGQYKGVRINKPSEVTSAVYRIIDKLLPKDE
jgi:hypothetical protein